MNYLLLLAIIPPILFNLTGLVDMFLTKKFQNEVNDWVLHDSIWTLMIIWWTIALLVSLVLLPFIRQDLSLSYSSLILVISWVAYWLAAYPYFQSLYHEKLENVIPLLQTIPVFAYILGGLILSEHISSTKIILMFLIVAITIIFSWDFKAKKMNLKGLIMILASAWLYAISFILFKAWWWEGLNIRTAFFREHLGVALVCLLRAIPRKTRETSILYFRWAGMKFAWLNIANELFYIVGVMILNFLFLLYPVAIVNTISNWVQPLLGFWMIWAAYKLYPKIFEREYSTKELSFKIIICIVVFILLFFFFQ
jgi:uncharacterized membrane protein